MIIFVNFIVLDLILITEIVKITKIMLKILYFLIVPVFLTFYFFKKIYQLYP